MSPPDYTGVVRLLYDWQTLITGAAALLGGLAAYVAGRIEAGATREAADRQIAAMARKDRLQARGIVVGVYPELLQLQVRHERASNVMAQWSSMRTRTMNTMSLVPAIREAKIELTPLLSRNIDNLFLVEPGGASLQQVVSYTLQYNSLIETLAQQIVDYVDSFDPPAHQQALSGNLRAIGMALADALREIAPIHDEAAPQ
jgi:hypothetical protein